MYSMNASSSFFDDETSFFTFKPVSNKPPQPQELSAQPLLISPLTCKSLSNGRAMSGTYALHKTLLVYYGTTYSKSQKSYLDLAYSKIKCNPQGKSNTSNSFVLTKNDDAFELSFADKKSMNDWLRALRQVCVLSNFHEEYKAVKMIGKGGFARVYLVNSVKSPETPYAVKAFGRDGFSQPDKARRKAALKNEIELMRALDHENIIKLHEVYESENSIYLVLDLVKGRPMDEVLSNRIYQNDKSGTKTVTALRAMLSALAYMASKGIMHRDLKPSNILVEDSGNIKIVDFGMATYINLPEYIYPRGGTPGYIAPEVFRYDPKRSSTAYGDKCDTFSIGCILYNMVFGKRFVSGSHTDEILTKNKSLTELQIQGILSSQASNSSFQTKTQKDVLDLLSKMLDYNHTRRISSADALKHPYCAVSKDSKDSKDETTKDITSLEMLESMLQTRARSHSSPRRSRKWSEGAKISSFDLGPASSKERITERDSLFLDLGKCEINGRLESISIGSMNNSIIDRREILSRDTSTSHSPTHASMFSKSQGLDGQRKNTKGFGTPKDSQSFLKAAIFRNIAMQSEVEEEESTGYRRRERLHSSDDTYKIKVNPVMSTWTRYASQKHEEKNEEDEDEFDVGDENSNINREYEEFVARSPEKKASKAMQEKKMAEFRLE